MTKADERRFARLDRLFQAALALPAAERDDWLAAQDEDAELLDEVRALLAEDEAGDFADLEGIVEAGWEQLLPGRDRPGPAGVATAEASAEMPADGDPAADPEQVGPYRILGRLGRGGQATVYLAERAGEFSMPVALKRIRRGMDTDDILERLRLERKILARLVHPNIGRIHDGGSDEEGRPYLVMEVIEGERVDHWCAERELSVRDRLKLFLQACEAVDFAHQNLILHRDLKPSNILVTDEGTVKLLDFGIAKVLAGDAAAGAAAQATVTGIENRLLTPDYASPEQLLGMPLTTASDVYSLGIVLFVLISGRLPYASNDNSSTSSLRGGEPRDAPSVSRVARKQLVAGNRLTAATDRRRTVADGELDAVVGKALEVEPSRRYSSVRELADDVVRLLEDRPVLARRPSLGYRLLKLARRHRVGVAVGALVVLSLLVAVIGTSWSAAVASRERQRAERQRAQAETVADFLVSLFEVSDPYSEAPLVGDLGELARPRGETVTARELLNAAAQRIDAGLQDDWRRRTRLRRAIARAYFNLSLHDRARSQLEAAAGELAAVDERPADGGDLLIARASVERDLGWLEARQGHFEIAERRLRAAEEQLLQAGDATRGEVAVTLEHLGELELLRGDPQASADRYEAALALHRELWGERSLEVARARSGLAVALEGEGRTVEATALQELVLEVRTELLGDQHPLVLETINDLVVAAEATQDHAVAIRIFEDLLRRQRQALGNEHADLAPTLFNLATHLDRLGRQPEAENLLEEAWGLVERSATERLLATKILMLQGLLRERVQDVDGAAALYQQALALRRDLFGKEHADTVTVQSRLGRLWANAGDRRAEPLLREVLEMSARLRLGKEVSAYLALGELALATGRPQVAESELRRGVAALGGRQDWLAGIVELRLAQALERLGRGAEALDSGRRARELLAASSLGPEHPWTFEAEGLVARLVDAEP